jgi:hypothetical protein
VDSNELRGYYTSCVVDLKAIPGAFEYTEGFSRPDWDRIADVVNATPPESGIGEAWDAVALQWVGVLRDELGGSYRISESDDYILLSEYDDDQVKFLLRVTAKAHSIILLNLGHLAASSGGSRNVILLFSELDDYDHYVAYFYRGAHIPQSGGVYINTGYQHIALRDGGPTDAAVIIVHELCHNCVHHLPVPAWLNEGVAVTLERKISREIIADLRGGIMDGELAERHHEFWNEANIQEFWAGTTFHMKEEAQALSYSLAEVLVHKLSGDHRLFLEFLANAHYDDAGQTAALDILGINLGDAVADFLGPGEWRPVRKAIVDCWKREEEETKRGEQNPGQ